MGAADNAPETLQLFDGTASQEIELPRMNFSEVYSVASGPVVLRLLENAATKLEDVPKEAPKANLPEAITDFYLLVTNNPKNKLLPVSMQIIDANAANFRKGQLLWFNLSQAKVAGKLGKEQLALKPRARQISKAPANGAEQYPVKLFYQLPGDKNVWPLCETEWLHNPQGRIVMFIIPEAGSRAPRIMGFPDFRQEEKQEQP